MLYTRMGLRSCIWKCYEAHVYCSCPGSRDKNNSMTDLEKKGFTFNEYDSFVANNLKLTNQHTILCWFDYIPSLHVN